jgi:serine/threonine protein kinase/tetratricopeptide (TPR) repeat protein
MAYSTRGQLETERLLRDACQRVEELTHQGIAHAADLVLKEQTHLLNDEESAIEIIYAEFVALEEAGRLPPIDQWLSRFPTYRTRLERLLKLHDFLSTDELQTNRNASSATAEISRERAVDQDVETQPFEGYQLHEEVGRGGMGIVYRATQRGIGRTVAVKVLRSIDSQPQVRARFQSEAETVGCLQHPNIVQVIEISLEQGREFLSMEYLGGGSLEDKLASQTWSTHEKADLLRTLSNAIQYAHERNIVHRDLKPSNILFTSTGVPKVVDFGLAKRVMDDASTIHSGALVGTPCYMSPEQAKPDGVTVGPSTDIYSLGVILYQMLTNRLPFEGKTAFETLKWIVDRDCDPPSRWSPSVPRDLETICLKCMSKRPMDRYKSASELSDDLSRFLDPLPIRARRAGVLERTVRLAKRHPQVTALLAAIVFVCVGASTLLTIQRRKMDNLVLENSERAQTSNQLRERAGKAEGAYEASLKKARDLVSQWTQIGIRLENEPGMDGLRRKAFEDALAYYDEVLANDQGDDRIRTEASQAALRAAHFHMDVGLWETAERELQMSDAWIAALPESATQVWQRSDCALLLGHVLRRVDRWEESEQQYHTCIEMVGTLLAKAPQNTSYLIRQSNAMTNLCVVLKYQKRWDEALETYWLALQRCTMAALIRAKQKIPDWLDRSVDNAAMQSSIGTVAIQENIQILIEGLNTQCQKLKESNPSSLKMLASENYLPEIALCLDDTAQVFEVKAMDGLAELCIEEAVALRQLSKEVAPSNRRIDQYLARGQVHLGSLLFRSQRWDRSVDSLQQADRIYAKLVEDFPDRSDYRMEWSNGLLVLARCHGQKRQWNDAIAHAEQSIALQEQILKAQPKSFIQQDSLAMTLFYLSRCLRHSGDRDKSLAIWERARGLAKDRPGPANHFAWSLILDDKLEPSELESALEQSSNAVRWDEQNPSYWNTRALVLAKAKQWDEGQIAIEKAMSLSQGGSASDWFIMGMVRAGLGDFGGAQQWIAKADAMRLSLSPNSAELARQSMMAAESLRQSP